MLIVCPDSFDIERPTAGVTIRVGYARGFARAGAQYRLISSRRLVRELELAPNSLVFLSCHDFPRLGLEGRRALRDAHHFVWVDPWFDGIESFYQERNLHEPALTDETRSAVLDSGAKFLWGSVPPSALEFFDGWDHPGQRIVALPLACDVDRYFPDATSTKYSDVSLAFVGGFWAYKNIQYDKYLKPYEDKLTVFGSSPWPYSGYRGQLPDEEERVLYRNARVCPSLSEPHAEFVGDIVERSFKVMGSGGLAVPDVVPFYRDLFSDEELLLPGSIGEYHDIITAVLTDESLNYRYREAGQRAVLERHTYEHRARQIFSLLGMNGLG